MLFVNSCKLLLKSESLVLNRFLLISFCYLMLKPYTFAS